MKKYERPDLGILEVGFVRMYRNLGNSICRRIVCTGNGGIKVNSNDDKVEKYISLLIEKGKLTK